MWPSGEMLSASGSLVGGVVTTLCGTERASSGGGRGLLIEKGTGKE